MISVFSFFVSPAFACTADQIDTGTECVDTKFSVTTTNLAANKEVKFYMSAKGTFYVDCGDGVAISGTGASGNTITRNDTTEALYSCAYTNGGVKTIKFGGRATGYNANFDSSAIRFNTDSKTYIAGVSGSLGQMLPTLGSASSGQQPRFADTFNGCANLTSISSELFNGVTGAASRMFYQTFMACSKLTSLPENLFSGIRGCAGTMFYSTFEKCSGLTSIPETLFENVQGGCSALFQYTFCDCTNLTTIPSNLFKKITTGQTSMFGQTFMGCTKLQSIPEGLFGNISNSAGTLFYRTFYGCSKLSGYIPASAFASLIANGCPTATSMWTGTFTGTQLSTTPTCPPSYKVLVTDYDTLWGGRTVCELPAPKIVTTSYVQGFYDEINSTKQDRLESGVNVITTGAPDGLVVSITADHGIVHVHKEEIQIPVGSVENPTNWLPIWVE